MTVRILQEPSCSAEPRGEGVVLKFNVLGSKFGPVQVEIDTGTALALVEEIEDAVAVQDEQAAAERGLHEMQSGGDPS